MFNAVDLTNELVNNWLEETRGYPVTLQLTKLGFKIIEALEAAYKAGQESQSEPQPEQPKTPSHDS